MKDNGTTETSWYSKEFIMKQISTIISHTKSKSSEYIRGMMQVGFILGFLGGTVVIAAVMVDRYES